MHARRQAGSSASLTASLATRCGARPAPSRTRRPTSSACETATRITFGHEFNHPSAGSLKPKMPTHALVGGLLGEPLADVLDGCCLLPGSSTLQPTQCDAYVFSRGAVLMHPRAGAMLLLFDAGLSPRRVDVYEHDGASATITEGSKNDALLEALRGKKPSAANNAAERAMAVRGALTSEDGLPSTAPYSFASGTPSSSFRASSVLARASLRPALSTRRLRRITRRARAVPDAARSSISPWPSAGRRHGGRSVARSSPRGVSSGQSVAPNACRRSMCRCRLPLHACRPRRCSERGRRPPSRMQ